MDNIREKLIEVIQNSVGGCARYWAEVIADGILSSGMIINSQNTCVQRIDCSYCGSCERKSSKEHGGQMINIREKLVELMKERTGCTYGGSYGDVIIEEEIDISDEEIVRIADHLITHGVMIGREGLRKRKAYEPKRGETDGQHS